MLDLSPQRRKLLTAYFFLEAVFFFLGAVFFFLGAAFLAVWGEREGEREEQDEKQISVYRFEWNRRRTWNGRRRLPMDGTRGFDPD